MNKEIRQIICDFYESFLNNSKDAVGFYCDAESYFHKLSNANTKLKNEMEEIDELKNK